MVHTRPPWVSVTRTLHNDLSLTCDPQEPGPNTAARKATITKPHVSITSGPVTIAVTSLQSTAIPAWLLRPRSDLCWRERRNCQ